MGIIERTVGAALRGRPCFALSRIPRRGGHGGPPLQYVPKDLVQLRIAFVTPEFVTESHFDGGLANYLNRVSKLLAEHGHEIHVITLSQKDEAEFDCDGVMVHRVMLSPSWNTFNRLSRYSFPTTLHWLNFSAQAYRKLKQLHRRKPFHLVQYPNYSFCGLFSIPLLRAAHVVQGISSARPLTTQWENATSTQLSSNVWKHSNTS